jgi:hypothetical protein
VFSIQNKVYEKVYGYSIKIILCLFEQGRR